jgi:hypothetical protein
MIEVGRFMAEPKALSNSAIVLRGGRNRPEDIRRGIGTHPSGITGISVECEEGISIQKLSALIPHGQIGVTTVGAVRAVGGDVIRTSGRSRYHATLTGLISDEISLLLTPVVPNPSKLTE